MRQTITVERMITVYDNKAEYLVVNAQNILDPPVNTSLSEEQVQALIDLHITVNIKRRSS